MTEPGGAGTIIRHRRSEHVFASRSARRPRAFEIPPRDRATEAGHSRALKLDLARSISLDIKSTFVRRISPNLPANQWLGIWRFAPDRRRFLVGQAGGVAPDSDRRCAGQILARSPFRLSQHGAGLRMRVRPWPWHSFKTRDAPLALERIRKKFYIKNIAFTYR